MTTLQLLIVCATALGIVGLRGYRPEPKAKTIGRRVTIHTRRPDDRSLTGVIDEETGSYVRLVDAAYVSPQGAQAVPGGVAVIQKANEAWRQEHESS